MAAASAAGPKAAEAEVKAAEVEVEDKAAEVEVEDEVAEPRRVIRRAFAAVLTLAAPEFGRGAANRPAAAIETACFNAAVRICKESADPLPRNWDSPQFVDVYSTRCGSVYQLLNPRSELNRVYAPQVVPRLLSGALTYAELGSLPERDLCPAALAEERAKIADRCRAEELAKLGLKVSTIFQCPHCKQRRCTYTEIQRRSLDEPPDYLCECLNPMCRRKFNGQT